MITHAKSNHSLSPSAVDTAVAISEKDGSVRRVEADMKIYLSYSINRKPIACLLHDIMTDVGANVALHSNQIDFSLYATVAVIVPLVLHSNVSFEPWVASAAALGCSHLCLLIVCARLACAFVSWSERSMYMCWISEWDYYRAKVAQSRKFPWMLFTNRGEKSKEQRKGRKEKEILKEKCGNVCTCEKAKESKIIHDYRIWEQRPKSVYKFVYKFK